MIHLGAMCARIHLRDPLPEETAATSVGSLHLEGWAFTVLRVLEGDCTGNNRIDSPSRRHCHAAGLDEGLLERVKFLGLRSASALAEMFF